MQNATKKSLQIAVMLAALGAPLAAEAMCWGDASQDSGIPVGVLKAVVKTESGFNPKAVHRNPDGSVDIGFAQINSRWLPKLEKFGIREEDLYDACTNLKVGAWILSQNAKKLGWNWNAIGAYNVGCAKLSESECERRRNQYAWKVHAALQKVGDIGQPPSAIASYEQGATLVSNHAVRGAVVAPQPKGIMAVRFSDHGPAMNVAAAYTDGSPSFTVGGFLNYEGGAADE